MELKFLVGDWMFLKVSTMKGIMRFRKKDKLISRYIGPYEIVKCIEEVPYELDLGS